jgi:cell division septation protein DedD
MMKPESSATPVRFYLKAVLLACLCLASVPGLNGQTHSDEVKSYIKMLDQGQPEQVRKALPDLVTKYQNTPDLLYLQGRLASDGIEAVKFYQSVVDNFPKSEYADNALYRIYQYYYAVGLYRTAEKKLAQLKSTYPNSPFASGPGPAKLPGRDEAQLKLQQNDTTAPETPAVVDTASAPVTKPPAHETPKPYTLQVGAFSTLANAEKQKSYFEAVGYSAEITNKVRNGRSLHLVWLGSYPNSAEAMRVAKEIKQKYKIDSIVVEKY